MGSLLGVAETKGAIYDALPADGVAVINADDAFAPCFAARRRRKRRRVLRFGLEASADVTRARASAPTREGSRFVLRHAGRARRRSRCRCRAATTCATRSPPRRWRSPPASPLDAIVAGLQRRAAGRRAARSRTASRNGAVADRRQLQRQSRLARRGHRHARRQPAARPGWCSATCANWARTREALHAAGRRARARRAASRGCTRSAPLSAPPARAFGDGARHFDTRTRWSQALRDGPATPTCACLVKGSRGARWTRSSRRCSPTSGERRRHAA